MFSIWLRDDNGIFREGNRPLLNTDTAVRLSYTENGVTRTTDITITVTGEYTPKVLDRIQVVQPPRTSYMAGEQFVMQGMTAIAIYTDSTTSPIIGMLVIWLRNHADDTGAFVEGNRALTVNDTVVRFSYTEGGITKTVDITITVTGSTTTHHTVIFDASPGWFTVGGAIKHVQVLHGTKAEIEIPTRTGFTFNGWFSTGFGNFDPEQNIYGNWHVYAMWTPNGGGGPVDTVTADLFNLFRAVAPAITPNAASWGEAAIQAGMTVEALVDAVKLRISMMNNNKTVINLVQVVMGTDVEITTTTPISVGVLVMAYFQM
jgi:uncharacterized repeat protein (TIGR02543 family)